MVPGQHHVRMNMCIAQAQHGRFHIVKHLGPIDPNERIVGAELNAVALSLRQTLAWARSCLRTNTHQTLISKGVEISVFLFFDDACVRHEAVNVASPRAAGTDR
jgi:hypothetical protein